MPLYAERTNALPAAVKKAYEEDARRKAYAELLQQGSDTSSARTPLVGLSRVAQALAGSYGQNKLEGEYQQQGDEYRKALAALMAPAGEGETLDYNLLAKRAGASSSPYVQDLGPELALKGIGTDAELTKALAVAKANAEAQAARDTRLEVGRNTRSAGRDAAILGRQDATIGAQTATAQWNQDMDNWRKFGGQQPPPLATYIQSSSQTQGSIGQPAGGSGAPQMGGGMPSAGMPPSQGGGQMPSSGNVIPSEIERNAQAKARGKVAESQSDSLNSAITAIPRAQAHLGQASLFDRAVDKVEYWGPGAGLLTKGKQVASAVVGTKQPVAENIVGWLNKEWVASMQFDESGNRVLAGQMSDSDRRYFEERAVGLGDTKEAAKLKNEVMRKAAKNQLAIGQLAKQYRNDPAGFEQARLAYIEANPVFDDGLMSRVDAAVGGDVGQGDAGLTVTDDDGQMWKFKTEASMKQWKADHGRP